MFLERESLRKLYEFDVMESVSSAVFTFTSCVVYKVFLIVKSRSYSPSSACQICAGPQMNHWAMKRNNKLWQT